MPVYAASEGHSATTVLLVVAQQKKLRDIELTLPDTQLHHKKQQDKRLQRGVRADSAAFTLMDPERACTRQM